MMEPCARTWFVVIVAVAASHLWLLQVDTKLKDGGIVQENAEFHELLCERCGYPGAGEDCFGKDAPDIPATNVCFPEPGRSYHCSRKYIIHGKDDPVKAEIVERIPCILGDPPYSGCNISSPDLILTPGMEVECFCSDQLGKSITEIRVPDNGDGTEGEEDHWAHQIDHEFCNARLQCFQCTDCLLPQNPQVCKREKISSKSSGKTTLLEIEKDDGRFAFCTVEVKNGVVNRGCGENVIDHPNDEWPHCGEYHWDHFHGRCKCFEQRCNNNFFYTHANVGSGLGERRALILPTPAFQRKGRPNPPKKPLLCHKCVQKRDTEVDQYKNHCLKRPDPSNSSEWEVCPNLSDVCYREYEYDDNSTLVLRKFMIKRKGCVGMALLTPDTTDPPDTTEKPTKDKSKHKDKDYWSDKGPRPATKEDLINGWYRDARDEEHRKAGPARIFFYCDTNGCNAATKCHQCTGSNTQCDTVKESTLMPCGDEFLRDFDAETEFTVLRAGVGVAQYCVTLTSGLIVRRGCRSASDFGTTTGYFGSEEFFPENCGRWGWDGVDKEAGYQECACGAEGCNSKEIISLAPPPLIVQLKRDEDKGVKSKRATGAGAGRQGQVVGFKSVILLILVPLVWVW